METALLAYVVPVSFGMGVYLQLARHPTWLEGLAEAWVLGWAAVNLLLFVPNQYLGVPIDGATYAGSMVALAMTALGLLWLRRDRLLSLVHQTKIRPASPRSFGAGLALLFVAFAGFVLYKSLITWPAHPDELIYHMELPKVAWQTGFLPLQPGLDLVSQGTAYPDLLVTQQLWVYLGGGGLDAGLLRPIMPVYTALLVLLLFTDARRWFGAVPAGVATAALLSLFSFTSLTFLMMDEVPVALCAYLGLRVAANEFREPRTPYLAGLFLGIAALVKFDGLAALLSLGLALTLEPLWGRGRDDAGTPPPGWRSSATRGLGFFAVALPIPFPLLFRNFARLGNPIYPYFFGGLNAQIPPALLSRVDIPGVVLQLISSEVVSLLATVLVAGILLGLLRRRAWTTTERLCLVFLVLYLPPYFAVPLLGSQVRYLAPVLPAMALFSGRQLSWLVQEAPQTARRRGAWLIVGILGLTAALAVWAPFYTPFNQEVAVMTVGVFAVSSAVVLALVAIASRVESGRVRKLIAVALILTLLVPGVIAVADEKSEADPLNWTPNLLPETKDAYLSGRLGPDWAMWTWMNGNLPANASVLSFEPRVYYIDARIVSAMSPGMMPTYNMTLPQALAFLRANGIGYVLDSSFGDTLFLNYLYVQSSPIFQNLADPAAFRVLHRDGTAVLYALAGAA